MMTLPDARRRVIRRGSATRKQLGVASDQQRKQNEDSVRCASVSLFGGYRGVFVFGGAKGKSRMLVTSGSTLTNVAA